MNSSATFHPFHAIASLDCPSSASPIELHSNYSLQWLKNYSEIYEVQNLANFVLLDPRFPIWSGSSKPFQHHYGKHGLIIHTAEVANLCDKNNVLTGNSINSRQLFLAALFHDSGKMWDYEPNDEQTEWQGTAHKRHIHHISRSGLNWQKAVDSFQNKPEWLTQEFVDEVLHAILAHHGQREWGSPVAPNTKLAWMLHLCDGISARLNDCDKWDQLKNV